MADGRKTDTSAWSDLAAWFSDILLSSENIFEKGALTAQADAQKQDGYKLKGDFAVFLTSWVSSHYGC